MKLWKYLLLLAGIAGVVGAFLPLVDIRHGIIGHQLTAIDMSFGLERTHAALDKRLPGLAEKHLPASARTAREDARIIAEASRGAAAAFAPAVLMGLFGLIAILRNRFARGFAAAALVLGLGSIGAWIGLGYVLEEVELKRTTITLQVGAHFLLVVGALGMIAGIGGLIRPQARRA